MEKNLEPFYKRHIGLTDSDINFMLKSIGVDSLSDLCDKVIPSSIRLKEKLELPQVLSENQALDLMHQIINLNKENKSFIGQGYYGTIMPSVIKRNLLENPSWYTAYTPYQAEISQGRLELLFHFQTMISDLTGLPIANASLLDEGTAIAEACDIAVRYYKSKRNTILIAGEIHPQSLAVVKTRAIKKQQVIETTSSENLVFDENVAALVIPYPDSFGSLDHIEKILAQAKGKDLLVIFVADPLALTLLESPAKLGASIAVGSMQRYGVPMGFGGPAAAYMAVREDLARLIPGRIVGLSVDRDGNPAYRLALQTREQHIRREKATSNICTSQVLLANIATAYAIWHKGDGLKNIAQSINKLAKIFAAHCQKAGYNIKYNNFFDAVALQLNREQAEAIQRKAYDRSMLLRLANSDQIIVNFDETSTLNDVIELLQIFDIKYDDSLGYETSLPDNLLRRSKILSQEVFNKIESETDMLRFLRYLSDKDLALDRSMIPLGSCTMKLNASSELEALSSPLWSNIHPFAPKESALGYMRIIQELGEMLKVITGFAKVSFQPNSGAQGEYAGMLTIRRYFDSIGQNQRNICLIPSSAHGTNPASAQMAGMKIIVIKCRENGDIDIEDLRVKAELHQENLAALMITYPSTHGVYEAGVKEICDIIHQYGGQVYFDGANMNALVALARPADIGADICHLNLHKTFAIPHGGGGPGAGPIAVAKHLEDFLPTTSLDSLDNNLFMVSSAPYGSASILIISWMYIRMMGEEGLRKATQCAVLSANYVAKSLAKFGYKILYVGSSDMVAHEAIIDTRIIKDETGVTVEDIAKRLIDYGFHAPTMSFPVPGTLMIEPTESEPLVELDRFCKAMGAIYEEAMNVKNGIWSKEDNPLAQSPHTAKEAICGEWQHSYSREVAIYPAGKLQYDNKYFPPVSRIDNVAGDRNLICSCSSPNEYE